jgi:SSS family solute:Na+ symporter
MTAVIVALYLLLMVGVGFALRGRVRSASDFLVAGQRLGLVLTTATFAALQLGAGVILGGAELGAESGAWPGMWYGLGCGGGLILAGLLVASRLRRHGAYVPLDFFGERYGEIRWVRFWAWLSNIPSLLGIFAVQVMASGSIFSLFGFSYAQGVVISGLVIMIYSVVAGMWGAVVTDFIQLTIILVGVPLITWTAMGNPGRAEGISFTGLLSTDFVPDGMATRAVFVILPFLLSISVSYDAYMRFQSARSVAIAKLGAILGGIIVIAVSFCVGLVGAAGKILYPEIDNGAILPHMIRVTLSPVLAGVVLSALLAAAMSSGNCLLISLAGCFSRDLYNKVLNPSRRLDELKYSKAISRGVIVGAVFIGILIALHARGILYTMIIFNYPYMGSMLVPLLGGVLWRRATLPGAVAAMIVGGVTGVISFLVGIPGPLHGLFNVDLGLLIAYAASAIVFVTVSLLTVSPTRESDGQQ